MSIKTTMTAIADKIRELLGTTGTMGLDAMATNLGDANNEVSNQAELITQIASALESKAAGGNATYETCTVNISISDYQGFTDISFYYVTIEDNEITIKKTEVMKGSSASIPCLCDSMIVFNMGYWQCSTSGVIYVANFDKVFIYGVNVGANDTAEFTFYPAGSGN